MKPLRTRSSQEEELLVEQNLGFLRDAFESRIPIRYLPSRIPVSMVQTCEPSFRSSARQRSLPTNSTFPA